MRENRADQRVCRWLVVWPGWNGQSSGGKQSEKMGLWSSQEMFKNVWYGQGWGWQIEDRLLVPVVSKLREI